MNKKVLSEPKNTADLITYWTWKVIDLNRFIVNLQRDIELLEEFMQTDVRAVVWKKVTERALLESLLRRHRAGEF